MNPVQWFFMIGGTLFLLAALFLREIQHQAAQIVSLTFGLIGVFWLVPMLIIWFADKRRS
jgi:ABC-type dipeptide/oligopeptide/nickel transport system permease component